PASLRPVFGLPCQTANLWRIKILAQWCRSRHDEPPGFAMLNLTRLHLGIAHESQFQGLGISYSISTAPRVQRKSSIPTDGGAGWPLGGLDRLASSGREQSRIPGGLRSPGVTIGGGAGGAFGYPTQPPPRQQRYSVDLDAAQLRGHVSAP